MRILLTGGSANGKSAYAESLAATCPAPRVYIACMRPYGEESERRIARHRAMRADTGFATVERYTDLAGLRLEERAGVALLECLCNLTANEMFDPDGAGAGAAEAILRGIEHLAAQCDTLLIVTNDVGADGGRYSPSTLRYIETLGMLNARIAASCERVLELVGGVPVVLKDSTDLGR